MIFSKNIIPRRERGGEYSTVCAAQKGSCGARSSRHPAGRMTRSSARQRAHCDMLAVRCRTVVDRESCSRHAEASHTSAQMVPWLWCSTRHALSPYAVRGCGAALEAGLMANSWTPLPPFFMICLLACWSPTCLATMAKDLPTYPYIVQKEEHSFLEFSQPLALPPGSILRRKDLGPSRAWRMDQERIFF